MTHGDPGSGCTTRCRCFDPARLIADMEALREFLGIPRCQAPSVVAQRYVVRLADVAGIHGPKSLAEALARLPEQRERVRRGTLCG